MPKDYDFLRHTHVTVRSHGMGPRAIVRVIRDRVWMDGVHTEVPVIADAAGILMVRDGVTNGIDDQGHCILSVPAALCEFWTEDEAETIVELMVADETLLSYAR